MCWSRHCTDIVINVFGFEILCYYKTGSILPINYSVHGIIYKGKETVTLVCFIYSCKYVCLLLSFAQSCSPQQH